jgi:PKD repeat protein
VYGTGYGYQQGPTRLEGAFRAKWNGDLDWLEDCHGDSYNSFPHNGAIYVVGHVHFCQNVGGFPQTSPGYRAMAFSRTAPNVVSTNTQSGYKDYAGQPAPSILHWFPPMTAGTITGQDQAAWSVTAAGDYVVMGGEFPMVNNREQQGLVRFATKEIAANEFGPRISDTSINPVAAVAPDGAVRVSWTANWDRDNKALRYDLIRNGDKANPVGSVTADSVLWQRPTLIAVDRNVAPNTSYAYQVIAYDAFDNDQESGTTSITTGSSTPPNFAGPYGPMVAGDGPSNFWRLGENSGNTTADWIGANPGSVKGGVNLGVAGALLDDPSKAATFDGSSNGYISTGPNRSGMNTFSVEGWFKSTTNQGGKIVGFGGATTGNSSSTTIDRHIYMLNDGRLTFGTYFSNAQRAVSSSDSYNDGDWHQVAGSVGPNGMELYVDGALVASRLDAKGGRNYSGNWRIGGDSLQGWPNRPTSDYFAGTIDEVSVYPNTLSAARILAHYNAATQPPQNDLPTAAFTFDSDRGDATFDGSGSTDPDGTISSYEWDFGDGASGTGATPEHTYAAEGDHDVTLTVTDNGGATDSVTHTVSIVIPPDDVLATDNFGRTVNNGWGTADFGGDWTQYGNPSLFKVDNGVGTMTMSTAGSGPRARLNSVSSSDVDLTTSVVLDKPATGGGTFVSATTRAAANAEYRAKVKIASSGQATVSLTKVVSGAETAIVTVNVPITTLTYTAGSMLWIRAQAVGTNSTALAAKVWLDSANEPGGWQVSTSDSTAELQAAGSVGLVTYLSGSATNAPMKASFDDLSVKKTQP